MSQKNVKQTLREKFVFIKRSIESAGLSPQVKTFKVFENTILLIKPFLFNLDKKIIVKNENL